MGKRPKDKWIKAFSGKPREERPEVKPIKTPLSERLARGEFRCKPKPAPSVPRKCASAHKKACKIHATRRAFQRCERQYEHYEIALRAGWSTKMRSEFGGVWHRFKEPSGGFVYGLWCRSKQAFVTFLTAAMWAKKGGCK